MNVLQSRSGNKSGSDSEYNFQPLSDLELWNIFRQVASGIRYLHYQNVVHGILSAELTYWRRRYCQDRRRYFKNAPCIRAKTCRCLNFCFMSPELFDTGKAFSGQLADIWAFGATMGCQFGNPPSSRRT